MGIFKNLVICIALSAAIVWADPVMKQASVGAEESLAREKRQIPIQTVPTFPPDVERTADGVPILDESYLDRSDRPAARFFAQFEPTTESEGLRLYEGLWATGGRNEPRSLDHVSDPFGENGIQPHHRQSAAWSTRKETKRFSSSRSGKSIQVRSGGSSTHDDDLPVSLLPSGFGPSTGPKFSEEVTYRRSNGGRRNNANLQTRSLTTHNNGENGFTCVTCRRASSSSSSSGHTGSSSAHQLRSLGHASEEASAAHGQSEGLRLYNKWLSQSSLRGSSNRNHLRSLDNEEDLLDDTSNTNGILPHHRNSASWTKREERRHSSSRRSKTISVRSGGSSAADLPAAVLPSGFGESTGPKFSEEVTYRRNAGGSRNSGNSATQTRSLSSAARRNSNNGERGFTCVTCRRSSSSDVASQTGSHNEVRSLDQNENWGQHQTIPASPPNVQTHTSSSWAENEERRHHQSRTSSSSSVPQNGGEVRVTDLENRSPPAPAHQSEEITYRRESSGSRGNGNTGCMLTNVVSEENDSSASDETTSGSYMRTNCTRVATQSRNSGQSRSAASAAQTRSLSSSSSRASGNGASGNGCTRCATRSSSSSLRTSNREGSTATSHRASRVPTTSDVIIPNNPWANTRSLDYPPVQTLGRGDTEVEARVLHSDDNAEHHASSAAENGEANSDASSQSASSGKKVKKAYYRRTVFKNYSTAAYPASLETWLGA